MQEANLSIDSPFFFLFCLAFNFTNFWSLSDHFEGSFLPQIRTTLSLQHNFFLWFFWKTTQLALFATCSHFRSNLDAPSEPFGKFFEQLLKSLKLLKCWISCENCPFLFWHVAFFNTNPSSGLKRNHKINAILKRFYKIQVEFTIILIILMLLVIITIMILHPTFLSSFKKHVFSPVLDLTINGPLFVGMMTLSLYIR